MWRSDNTNMQTIVKKIGKGDINAFQRLFKDFYPVLCAFADKYLEDPGKAKDFAQDAFVSYWKKREDFEELFQVKSFLYTVVRNNSLNALRKAKINQLYLEEVSRESEAFYEEQLITQETYLLVRQAVESLPPQMRTIINYAMQGLKNPQIATEMGIATGTVHALKKTAYKKLREQLQDHVYIALFIHLLSL